MHDIRIVPSRDIHDAILDHYRELSFSLDLRLQDMFRRDLAIETEPGAQEILEDMLKNAVIAEEQNIPPCQDTGTQVFFIEIGNLVHISGDHLESVINEAVAEATEMLYLRRSIVRDPLYDRVNSGDNTPAVIHTRIVPGSEILIHMGQKGGGAENMSRLIMLKPDATPSDIIELVVETVVAAGGKSCPPIILGIGLGGNFESCASLAKRALFRELGESHPLPEYARLEQEILLRLNETGIGPQGLGGNCTALAVHLETAPCHIASLPLAINIQCHSHRHLSFRI